MKILMKSVMSVVIAVGLIMPMAVSATVPTPAAVSMSKPDHLPPDLVKVQLKYMDSHKVLHSSTAYVPKDKVVELHQAKQLKLYESSCADFYFGACGGPQLIG